MQELKAGTGTYNLYWVTGKVVGQGKYATTTVSGGGGGGAYSRVTISSSTPIHNDIFLVDSNRQVHSFQLSNFNIACREGNQLTVICAIRKGKKEGLYIAVLNHTTSQKVFDSPALGKMFLSWSGILFLILWFWILYSYTGIFWSILIWCITIPIIAKVIKRIAKSRANRFKSNFKFEDFQKEFMNQ